MTINGVKTAELIVLIAGIIGAIAIVYVIKVSRLLDKPRKESAPKFSAAEILEMGEAELDERRIEEVELIWRLVEPSGEITTQLNRSYVKGLSAIVTVIDIPEHWTDAGVAYRIGSLKRRFLHARFKIAQPARRDVIIRLLEARLAP